MNQNLQNILELQTALDQLREAEQRLHGIPDWMRELHEEHAAARPRSRPSRRRPPRPATERRAAEAAVQDAQEKLKKYQQQINKVSTQREYGALLQEIDTVKGQIAANEEQALRRARTATRRPRRSWRAAARELPRDRGALRRRADPLGGGEARGRRARSRSSQARIAGLKERLPRGIVSQFERILERYPAAPSRRCGRIERPGQKQREWHCAACNYRVRPQVVVEIRNGGSPGPVRLLQAHPLLRGASRPERRAGRGLAERLAGIRARIAERLPRAPAAGPASVTLVGASKTQPAAVARRGLAGGPARSSARTGCRRRLAKSRELPPEIAPGSSGT